MKIPILLLLTILVLGACTTQTPSAYTCPDGTVVADAADCPPPAQETEEPAAAPPPPPPPVPATTTPPVVADPELQDILGRNEARLKSYSFLHVGIRDISGAVRNTPTDHYYVKGNLARVDVNRPQSVNPNTYVDTVYLNLGTETARGFCMNDRLHTCSVKGEEREANYQEYTAKLPLDWLDQIPVDATVGSEINFEERPVKVVRWHSTTSIQGLPAGYYEAYIDQFMGVPLRVAVYSNKDYGGLLEGVEYQEMAYNLVKDEDVTPS